MNRILLKNNETGGRITISCWDTQAEFFIIFIECFFNNDAIKKVNKVIYALCLFKY